MMESNTLSDAPAWSRYNSFRWMYTLISMACDRSRSQQSGSLFADTWRESTKTTSLAVIQFDCLSDFNTKVANARKPNSPTTVRCTVTSGIGKSWDARFKRAVLRRYVFSSSQVTPGPRKRTVGMVNPILNLTTSQWAPVAIDVSLNKW